jgi:hypothetical protein
MNWAEEILFKKLAKFFQNWWKTPTQYSRALNPTQNKYKGNHEGQLSSRHWKPKVTRNAESHQRESLIILKQQQEWCSTLPQKQCKSKNSNLSFYLKKTETERILPRRSRKK